MDRDPTRERLIFEENRRMVLLRRLMDRTQDRLRSPDVHWEEARRLIAAARETALRLFPGKGEVFDLVYKPRFYKVLDEKWHLM